MILAHGTLAADALRKSSSTIPIVFVAVSGDCRRSLRQANQRHIGTALTDPNIDFATVARGFGVHGEGPVTNQNDLAPALKRAIAAVKSGQPALVDVVTDPR